MIRLLVWCAGSVGWGYLIWRYHYWHELFAVVVVVLAAMWTLGGAFAISRGRERGRNVGANAPQGKSIFHDAIAQAERARQEREAANK
jgi:hypothetical protein